jgi:hypothetical protein
MRSNQAAQQRRTKVTDAYLEIIKNKKAQPEHKFLKGLGRDALGAVMRAHLADFSSNPSATNYAKLEAAMLAYQDLANDERDARRAIR